MTYLKIHWVLQGQDGIVTEVKMGYDDVRSKKRFLQNLRLLVNDLTKENNYKVKKVLLSVNKAKSTYTPCWLIECNGTILL